MSNYRAYDTIFLFNMVHTPADTKECPYQRHGSEEPHILTKQDKMKQQICNINNMKSIFGPFQSLHNDYTYLG